MLRKGIEIFYGKNFMLEKIKNIIDTSKSFAVILSPNPEDHEILLKEVLLSELSEKKLPTFSFPKKHDTLNTKWAPIAAKKPVWPFPQKTSIKLPKSKYPVKEVAYSEDDEHLSFIITSANEAILKEDLVLETLPPQIDAAFCFFDDNSEILEIEEARLPEKDKIIFITQNDRTLTEKIFDISQIINPNILTSPEVSTLFFAALLRETNNFSEKITGEMLSLGSLFLKNGAKKDLIASIIEKENNFLKTQLFGRLMARTYVDEFLNVSFSFLSHKDLQKTNTISASPEMAYEMLKQVRTLIPPQKLNFLIWPANGEIKILLSSSLESARDTLARLASKMDAEVKNKFFVAGPFENFSQAEVILRSCLKEILYNL